MNRGQVDPQVQRLAHSFLWKSLVLFLILIALAVVAIPENTVATVIGFGLAFLFVGSNFFVIKRIKAENSADFVRHFYLSMGVRFILVLILFVGILKVTKIHQIYFTVSFIISYIFHSVIEMISINKLLETDN